MRTLMIPSLAVAIAVASSACGPQAGSLQAANDTLGAAQVNAIQFPDGTLVLSSARRQRTNLPWPAFDVSSYTATINYAAPAARVQMTRKQTIEPGRVPPGSRRTEARSIRERNNGVESGRGGRCRTQCRPRRAAAAGCRRGTRDGDLDDAARIPQSGSGKQCDVDTD